MAYKKHYRRHRYDAWPLGLPILDRIAKECLDELKSGAELDSSNIVVDRDVLYDFVTDKMLDVTNDSDKFDIMKKYQKAEEANYALAVDLATEDIMSFLDRNFDGDISF